MFAKFKSKEEIIVSLNDHGYYASEDNRYENSSGSGFGDISDFPFLKKLEIFEVISDMSNKERSGYKDEAWYDIGEHVYPKDFFVGLKEKLDKLLEE